MGYEYKSVSIFSYRFCLYFKLPSIEAVIKSPPVSRDNRHPPIIVLVVCPTRELACQAAAEANILLKYHSSIGVEVVIGGTKLPAEQRRMQKHPCQVRYFFCIHVYLCSVDCEKILHLF